MTHALVVGGTGVLRAATMQIAERFETVTVIARSRDRLRALHAEAAHLPATIHALALDYRDSGALRDALMDAQASYGPIDLAVCWIHSVAPDAPGIVASCAALARSAGGGTCDFVHVVGSAAADPSRDADDEGIEMEGVQYRQVVLGFVIDGGRSRWLTDNEISTGVMAAVESSEVRSIVGVVRPWDRKP